MAKEKTSDAKRVHFYADKESHIRFRACLTKHNMTMSEFFRACCQGVIDDEKNMLIFLDEYRKKSENHSKRNNKIIQKDKKKGDSILQEFGFEEKDIKSLFDTIAQHNPEI